MLRAPPHFSRDVVWEAVDEGQKAALAMSAPRGAVASAVIVGIPGRPPRALLDFPVGRGEEADAVRHAREPEQAGAFREAHEFLRQIERAPELLPARALVPQAAFRRPAFAHIFGDERCLSGAARHPIRRRQIVRREALHDTGIGEEGFPALLVERFELGQVLADSGDLHLVAAYEAEGVFERAEMAEGGHLVDHEERPQAARTVEGAQRRHDDKAQPDAMRPHAFGGQDDIDRRRLFLELGKIHPGLFQILAHRLRQYPARLRVGGRADARKLVRLFGEAGGEAGDFIAALGDHIGGGEAEAAFLPFAHFAVLAGVPLPCVGFGQQRADIFEIGARAVFQLVPHDKRDDEALPTPEEKAKEEKREQLIAALNKVKSELVEKEKIEAAAKAGVAQQREAKVEANPATPQDREPSDRQLAALARSRIQEVSIGDFPRKLRDDVTRSMRLSQPQQEPDEEELNKIKMQEALA
jgi:hypothetical protein